GSPLGADARIGGAGSCPNTADGIAEASAIFASGVPPLSLSPGMTTVPFSFGPRMLALDAPFAAAAAGRTSAAASTASAIVEVRLIPCSFLDLSALLHLRGAYGSFPITAA